MEVSLSGLLERWYRALGVIVIVGYAAWLLIAVARGATVAAFRAVLNRDLGAIHSLKLVLAPVAGVTTLTQLSCVVSAIGAHRLVTQRRVGRMWVFVLVAGVLRALFYAERLALMEVVIPAAIVLIVKGSFFRRRRALLRMAPVFGLMFVVVVFSISEYFRSWIFYASAQGLPFWRWVLERLFGYYATAFNNNALYYSQVFGSPHAPYFTVPFIYNFPGYSTVFEIPTFGGMLPDDWWSMTLASYANPEFNNIGSALVPLADFGILGGMIFWFVIGLLLGFIYRGARLGSDVAIVAYAAVVLGLFELPRFTYWTLGRFFPAAVAVLLMLVNSRKYAVQESTPLTEEPVRFPPER